MAFSGRAGEPALSLAGSEPVCSDSSDTPAPTARSGRIQAYLSDRGNAPGSALIKLNVLMGLPKADAWTCLSLHIRVPDKPEPAIGGSVAGPYWLGLTEETK